MSADVFARHDTQGKRKNYAARHIVATLLRAAGVPAQTRREPKLLSEGLTAPESHVDLPGWAVVVRSGTELRLRPSVRLAEDFADLDGREYSAVLHLRGDESLRDAVAVLSLEQWVRIVARLHGRASDD